MNSASKVVETIKDCRQGYGVWIPLSEKVVWNTVMDLIPDNCKYISHITEDVFIPYVPQRTERAQALAGCPAPEQDYILGDTERTVTAYYEPR